MINNVDNFVEETLIISTMWKATWDIFHNKVSTCQKCQKSRIICFAKNLEIPAFFVEETLIIPQCGKQLGILNLI